MPKFCRCSVIVLLLPLKGVAFTLISVVLECQRGHKVTLPVCKPVQCSLEDIVLLHGEGHHLCSFKTVPMSFSCSVILAIFINLFCPTWLSHNNAEQLLFLLGYRFDGNSIASLQTDGG